MNRRQTIKTLMAASVSLAALPAWAENWSADDLRCRNTAFPPETQQTLAAVADTIIPAGDSVGALSVGVDKFLAKLFEDCYEQEVQHNIKNQLQALENAARNLYSSTFAQCAQAQREEMLNRMALSEIKDEADFFTLIKAESIRGFTTSREVMVNFYKFKQVPGHYYGCVDVNA